MSIHRLLVVAYKEFRHIIRDLRILSLVTVAPAFLLIALSYVFAMDVGHIDFAVWNLDHSSLSRQLVDHLTADGDFVIVTHVRQESEIRPLLMQGRIDLVLVIPHGLAEAALDGGPAELHCIVDGSDAVAASQTLALLEGRMNAFVTKIADPNVLKNTAPHLQLSSLSVRDRAWYNRALKSLVSMVPAMLAIILCMPALALALALAREKETGSFESLIATPVRGTEYLFGKLLAYQVGGLVSAVLAWLVATMWFHVPFRGSFLAFLLLTADYMIASMGFSLMIANFVQNQQTAMFLVLMIFFVPSFFISGLLLPISDQLIVRAIAYALPSTHFITVCRGLFLKGLGPLALWRPTLALLSIGVASQIVSLILFEKRLG